MKKRSTIFTILLIISLVGNNTVVATPSSDNVIGNWINASCAWLGVDKTTFWGGAAALLGLGGFYGYKYYQNTYKPKHYLKDTILKNPKKALDYADRVSEEFRSEALSRGLDKMVPMQKANEEIRKLYTSYMKACPIFLLGECVKEDWGHCLLSRAYQPRYRKTFEERVKTALQEKIKANKVHNKVTYYTGHAVGGSFQDLVAITKTLEELPDARMHVDLIDLEFTPYTAYLDTKNNRRIDMHQAVCFDADSQKILVDRARKEWGATERDSDQDIAMQLERAIDSKDLKAKQFVGFLRCEFPKADISLAVHGTVDSYLDYVTHKDLAHADVVAAADMQDEMSQLKGSIRDYVKLCTVTLQNNPASRNIWLGKKDYTKGAINTFTSQPTPGFEEVEANNSKLYTKEEVI